MKGNVRHFERVEEDLGGPQCAILVFTPKRRGRRRKKEAQRNRREKAHNTLRICDKLVR